MSFERGMCESRFDTRVICSPSFPCRSCSLPWRCFFRFEHVFVRCNAILCCSFDCSTAYAEPQCSAKWFFSAASSLKRAAVAVQRSRQMCARRLSILQSPVRLPCSHHYCATCVVSVDHCAICRVEIGHADADLDVAMAQVCSW